MRTKRGDTEITLAPDPHHRERGSFRAIRSLSRNELPQNEELSNLILRSKQALETNKSNVNEHGRLLLDDTQQVLDSVNRMLRSKNADGKLQRLTQMSRMEAERARKRGVEQAREHKEEGRAARAEAMTAISGGYDVAVLLVRSQKFRSLVTELIAMVPKLAGRVTERHGSDLARSFKEDTQQLRDDEKRRATEGSRTADVLRSVRDDVRENVIVTEEEKSSVQDKFIAILREISGNERYKSTVNTLFGMDERYRPASERTRERMAPPRTETQQMQRDARNLLSEFVGYETVDHFYDALDDFVSRSRRDEDAISFWRELRRFTNDSLNNPAMLDSDIERRRLRNLFDQGRRVFIDKDELYDSLDRLNSCGMQMLTNIKNDEDLNNLRESLSKLMSDATLGPDGKPNVDTILSSSREIRSIIVPTLKQQLHNVPLPKIIGRTSRYEYELENMTIDGRELLPDTFFLDTRTKFWVSTNRLSANNIVYKLKFFIEDIRPRMHNFMYRVRTLSFPKIEDYGRASIDFEGRGISFLVKYELNYVQNRQPFIRVSHVNTNIDRMHITIHEAKHKLINRTLLKLFGGVIKRRIARTIERRVYSQLQNMDNRVNTMIGRAYSPGPNTLITRGKTATNEMMGMAYQGTRRMRSRARQFVGKFKRGGSRMRDMIGEERQKAKTGHDRVPTAEPTAESTTPTMLPTTMPITSTSATAPYTPPTGGVSSFGTTPITYAGGTAPGTSAYDTAPVTSTSGTVPSTSSYGTTTPVASGTAPDTSSLDTTPTATTGATSQKLIESTQREEETRPSGSIS